TPLEQYQRRRDFIKNAALFAGTAAAMGTGLTRLVGGAHAKHKIKAEPPPLPVGSAPRVTPSAEPGLYTLDEARTPFDDITTYNNYYELGLSKTAPSENAGSLKPRPWTVAIEGEVKKALTVDLDTILGWYKLEERVYRM